LLECTYLKTDSDIIVLYVLDNAKIILTLKYSKYSLILFDFS